MSLKVEKRDQNRKKELRMNYMKLLIVKTRLQYTPKLDYNTRRQKNQHQLLKLYPDPLKLWLLVWGVL
jgi:hypothetical protein